MNSEYSKQYIRQTHDLTKHGGYFYLNYYKLIENEQYYKLILVLLNGEDVTDRFNPENIIRYDLAVLRGSSLPLEFLTHDEYLMDIAQYIY